jgi:clan AA aspartic protease (TIGR02281 family)
MRVVVYAALIVIAFLASLCVRVPAAQAQVFFNTPFGTFGIGGPVYQQRPYRRPPPQRQAPTLAPPPEAAYTSDADVICGRPQILFNLDKSPDLDPVTSVEVSYEPKQHAWRVFHHLSSGGVVSRTEQYAAVDTSSDRKVQWNGSLNRNRSMFMVGEVRFNDQKEPFYYEWLYNRSQGNRLEMSLVARCEWNRQEPLPSPSSQAKPPVVAGDDKRVKTVPYRSSEAPQAQLPASPAQSRKDSIPIYPGHEGNAVLVDVIVGGQPVRMLLDTGATHISINRDLANRIVAQAQGSWGGTVDVRLADGSVVKERIINIETVNIGSHTIRNVQGSVTDGETMLLPFPLVNSIAPFKIDTRNRELVFEKEEATR